MVRFVEGQKNTIKVSIASSIDVTGFSIKIAFSSAVKTISSFADGSEFYITFSSSDIAQIPTVPMWGAVAVLDAAGNVYQKMMVEAQKVSKDEWFKAIDYTELPIVIAANWTGIDPGGGDTPDPSNYVKRSDFTDIADPKNSVNSNTSTISQILSAAKGN